MPPADHILFESLTDTNNEFVRPLTVRSWMEGQSFFAEVRLFGYATPYAKVVAAALELAMRRGIALGSTVRQRVSVKVLELGMNIEEVVDIPAERRNITICIRTPIARIRKPPDIIKCMIRRVHNLAPWQGFRISAHPDAMCAIADDLNYDLRDALPYRWTRHSRRQKGKDIPVWGQLGRIQVSGALGTIMPYVAIASATNTGVNAGLGLGWFDLA